MPQPIRKKTQEKSNLVETMMDVEKFAWEGGLKTPRGQGAVPPDELAKDFPHFVALFAMHKGKPKSSFTLTRTVKALKVLSVEELLAMDKEDWEEHAAKYGVTR